MFNLFKKKKKEEKPNLKRFLVDNLFYITTINNFEKVESDKFRIATSNNSLQLSISNYVTRDNIGKINKDLMKTYIPMYDDFIQNGGFEPVDKLRLEDDFISQAFKVGNETQYYLTTVKRIKDSYVTSNLIIKSFDTYNEIVSSILETTYNSIQEK